MIVVNPIMGGGLSNAKLALADAVAANVLSGKKFYSGDKVLKTGTLSLAATATPADVVAGKTFFAGGTTKKTGTRGAGTYRVVTGTFETKGEGQTITVSVGSKPLALFAWSTEMSQTVYSTFGRVDSMLGGGYYVTNHNTGSLSSTGLTITDNGFTCRPYSNSYYYYISSYTAYRYLAIVE